MSSPNVFVGDLCLKEIPCLPVGRPPVHGNDKDCGNDIVSLNIKRSIQMKTKYLLYRVCLLSLVCLIPVLSGCSATTRMVMKAEGGKTQKVARMLDEGVDVNSLLADRSALFYASQNGHTDTVKLLLDRGADPNIETKDKITALRLAVERRHLEVLDLLLDAGADPNVKRKQYGNIPIHIACWKGHGDILSVLIQRGSQLNSKNALGMTPLIMAARYGYDDLVKMLIEGGADIDIADNNDLTALHYACVHGKGQMVPALLAAGADPNAKTSAGLTPLHLAATQRRQYRKRDDYEHRKKLLIAAGTDPDVISDLKQSADDVYSDGLLAAQSGRTLKDYVDQTERMQNLQMMMINMGAYR